MNLQMMSSIGVLSKDITLDLQEVLHRDSLKDLLKANILVFKKELKREFLKGLTLALMKDFDQELDEFSEMQEPKTYQLTA